MTMSPAVLPQRLSTKIQVADNGCWLWSAGVASTGYGAVWDPARRVMASAHRFIWELLNGPVPDGLELDHLCRVRLCCNPKHLEPVTRGENTCRGALPGLTSARLLARTHCTNGHPYGDNPPQRTDHPGRRCRECHRIRAAAYRERQRAS